jgi:hypothetical protein
MTSVEVFVLLRKLHRHRCPICDRVWWAEKDKCPDSYTYTRSCDKCFNIPPADLALIRRELFVDYEP